MLVYDINSIKQITNEDLIYIDNEGIKQHICFKDCSRNYARNRNEHIHEYINWDGSPVTPIIEDECRHVADRNWFVDKPYFVFIRILWLSLKCR